MGRIFEKRKVKMFARWAKTAKAFTKLGKEIAIAVKLGGPDPDSNPRLRMAVQTARSLNMPKDRIESAIQRASSKDQAGLDEITYSGYAPHGVAIMIVAATDNPTRTVANVRSILTHHKGSMAASGALDFLFKRMGVFRIKSPSGSVDELELELIDHGLDELERDEESGELVIHTTFEQFGAMQRALEERKLELISAGLQWSPNSQIELDDPRAEEVKALIDELEEDDDIQHVFHNIA